MSGNGKPKEGVAVVLLVQFVSIPADSLCALHQSAKHRIRLTVVKTAVSMITTIMPADGVDVRIMPSNPSFPKVSSYLLQDLLS